MRDLPGQHKPRRGAGLRPPAVHELRSPAVRRAVVAPADLSLLSDDDRGVQRVAFRGARVLCTASLAMI